MTEEERKDEMITIISNTAREAVERNNDFSGKFEDIEYSEENLNLALGILFDDLIYYQRGTEAAIKKQAEEIDKSQDESKKDKNLQNLMILYHDRRFLKRLARDLNAFIYFLDKLPNHDIDTIEAIPHYLKFAEVDLKGSPEVREKFFSRREQ